MKKTTLQDYKQRMLRVLVYIQHRLDEDIALDELARQACFSPFHFHRIFKGMLGESVQEHIRRLRLERAANRLKNSAWSVTRIALDAGFESPEAFGRAFKDVFGHPPSKYRMLRQPLLKMHSVRVHYQEDKLLHDFKTVRKNPMKVSVKNISPMRVAFVRHVGPYDQCGAAWDKLCPFLGKNGMIGPDTKFIGLSYDDPEVTPPDKIRYDACVTIDEEFQAQGEIGVQTIAGGLYAITTHLGSFDKLKFTYAALMGQWLPRSGYELRPEPCFEQYMNDPDSTAPEDLITDIYLPLKNL